MESTEPLLNLDFLIALALLQGALRIGISLASVAFFAYKKPTSLKKKFVGA